MKKLNQLFLSIAAFSVLFYSCEQDEVAPISNSGHPEQANQPSDTLDLEGEGLELDSLTLRRDTLDSTQDSVYFSMMSNIVLDKFTNTEYFKLVLEHTETKEKSFIYQGSPKKGTAIDYAVQKAIENEKLLPLEWYTIITRHPSDIKIMLFKKNGIFKVIQY